MNNISLTEKNNNAKMKIAKQLYDWVEIIAISISFLILVLCLVCRYSPVSGESMNETLQDSDVVIISDLFYTPSQGDIVVFESTTTGYDKPYIKRVIATEGQTIDYDPDSGVITVDGEVLQEDYATYKGVQRSSQSYTSMFEGVSFTYPYTVPEGHVFCMGDNRWNSHDSRDIGPVDVRCIVGHVIFRLLPFDSFGSVK